MDASDFTFYNEEFENVDLSITIDFETSEEHDRFNEFITTGALNDAFEAWKEWKEGR